MKRIYKKKKGTGKAKEDIREFFRKAKEAKTNRQANDYIRKARNLAMKFKVRLTPLQQKKFCKHCYAYFTSENRRIRISNGKVVYYCKVCKKYMRFPIKNMYYPETISLR